MDPETEPWTKIGGRDRGKQEEERNSRTKSVEENGRGGRKQEGTAKTKGSPGRLTGKILAPLLQKEVIHCLSHRGEPGAQPWVPGPLGGHGCNRRRGWNPVHKGVGGKWGTLGRPRQELRWPGIGERRGWLGAEAAQNVEDTVELTANPLEGAAQVIDLIGEDGTRGGGN